MNNTIAGTQQKALAINRDPLSYGSFAEIGAGQEVARWFFHVGGAGSAQLDKKAIPADWIVRAIT